MAGQDPRPMRVMGMVGGMSLQLAIMAGLGALLGHYLDTRWGSDPWLLLTGLLVGTGLGLWQVVTEASRAGL